MSERYDREAFEIAIDDVIGAARRDGEWRTISTGLRVRDAQAILTSMIDATIDNETTLDDGIVRVPLTALHDVLAWAEIAIDYCDDNPSDVDFDDLRQAMIVLQALAGDALSASSAS
jgi:hypothetical protein